MNCVKHKPKGKGGCNAGLVTQTSCPRKAVVLRETTAGKRIALCQKCDDRFGDVVGKAVARTS